MWSRLSVSFIRTCEPFPVLDQLEDDGNYVQIHYEKERSKPLLPLNWSDPKKSDL